LAKPADISLPLLISSRTHRQRLRQLFPSNTIHLRG
jgi:hypothetical protein